MDKANVVPASAVALKIALAVLGMTLQVPSLAMEQALEVDIGGIKIHGSLLTPDLQPTKACALIIAGSGPTDRDGNSTILPGNNNSLKYLAESLQSLSIESFRYDKRQVGKSVVLDQDESDLRFTHYVDDAMALFDWLDRRCDTPVFLIGHSEGGHIALTAAQQRASAGLIILAGPGTHPADLIASQLAKQIGGDLLERSEQVLLELRQGRQVASPPQALAALFRPSVQPYMISWFKHDPLAQIGQISVPILLVYGATDLQVPAADGEALKLANPDAELQVISGMNHVLKLAEGTMAQQMASYSDPALPLAPELPRVLAKFMLSKK